MLLTWASQCLRNAGLTVVDTQGCHSRSHGDFPEQVSAVWHHDASKPGDSPGTIDWLISNWNKASANFWVNRAGIWYLIGVGVSWHAGETLSGMPTNYTSYGVETDQTVNEVPALAMLDSVRRGIAALQGHQKLSSASVHFHKTIASPKGRKQDPWFDSTSDNISNWQAELDRERAYIQSFIGGSAPLPPTDPPTGDDDMPYSPEQLVQFASSGFARGAKTELLKVGDGPEQTPTELTLERWAKVTNDRIWQLEQDMAALKAQ